MIDDETDDSSKLTPTPGVIEYAELLTTTTTSPIDESREIAEDVDAAGVVVAPEPDSTIETAEDALSLLMKATASNITDDDDVTAPPLPPPPPPPESERSTDLPPPSVDTVVKERRASHTWKGFKFKKQLSKVDLKIKNTFSNQSASGGGGSERAKRNSIFHVSAQGLLLDSATAEKSPDDETSVTSTTAAAAAAVEESNIPEIREPERTPDGSENAPIRPTDLKLFETDGDGGADKPARPCRRKERSKRFSFDRQGPRDKRLLSVPNIKYQNVATGGAAKDAKKSKPSNNQAFFSLIRRLNKLDSTFSRSRSSSMSSLENISSESVQCLVFADSYIKKSDAMTVPTIWIGTSVGSVFYLMANVPPAGETRLTTPVTLSTVGSLPRMKGGILTISFLDCTGALIRYSYEQWKDESKEKKTPTKSNPGAVPLTGNIENSSIGGTGSTPCDKQFVVVVSEKQARVSALPSHECVFKQQLTETDFVVKADVILLKDSVCLLCYLSNSRIMAFSLPSLKLLIDVEFLPLSDLRIAKTFCFSNRGHGLYFSSPSEIQKFTVSAEFYRDMSELVGELFLPRDMPEPPKLSLFKSLLGGGARSVDREELFGESSGKPVRSVAKHIPGPSGQIEQLGKHVQHSTGEVSRAHMLMVERGEKLGQLEDRTQRMMMDAEKFASNAHELMQKSKDKKWYQL